MLIYPSCERWEDCITGRKSCKEGKWDGSHGREVQKVSWEGQVCHQDTWPQAQPSSGSWCLKPQVDHPWKGTHYWEFGGESERAVKMVTK